MYPSVFVYIVVNLLQILRLSLTILWTVCVVFFLALLSECPRYHGSCVWMTVSLPRRGTENPFSELDTVTCAVVTRSTIGRKNTRITKTNLFVMCCCCSHSNSKNPVCLNPQNLLRMWSWYINQCLCSREDLSTRETGATSTLYPFTQLFALLLQIGH